MTIQEHKNGRQFEFHRVDKCDPDIEYLTAYFGLENFPYDQLVCQNPEMKKLFFISEQVSNFLYSDPKH